ncbi:hypothetical protein A6E05_13665 [Aliivibrio sp. 1S165]|uniref:hypothetical protein n=1 Tax=unclassified Aliivibrio TaxID=2645654 RepID=UPI00080E6FF5|nr:MULTISPECIES: hypothetical protein [unclassified Aliivibrio]OCH17745.1 hypothetical protein A6E05_13665 [Aliivibrio sp. 1S165]OCH31848.1 hypothetical protein A6E06_19095 [Aliivibrio sp. 1S175]
MSINNWYYLKDFLFEKNTEDKTEKFTTYVSPYFVPKAYRYGCSKSDNMIVEFKYIDVTENTRKMTHPENHKIYFKVGDKTGRIYKVYLGSSSNECKTMVKYLDDLDKAFENLANKLSDGNKEQYAPTLVATKNCLSKLKCKHS